MTDSPTDNVAPQPLDRCPVCRYSLEGLPKAHQCPECGLFYDPETVVFKTQTSNGHRLICSLVLLACLERFVRVLDFIRSGNPIDGEFWFAMVVFLILALTFLYLATEVMFPPSVIINQEGILFCSRRKMRKKVHWNEISNVKTSPERQGPYRFEVSVHGTDKCLKLFPRSYRELVQLEGAVDRRLETKAT